MLKIKKYLTLVSSRIDTTPTLVTASIVTICGFEINK
jgi:hypothetical protein